MKESKDENTSPDILLAAIGDVYCSGFGLEEKDYGKALQFYRKAASMGNAHACYMIGECLYKGRGCEKSISEAMDYYEDAAASGSIGAMLRLGDIYWNGVASAVPVDRVKASQWYIKALDACQRTSDMRSLPYAYVRVARCLKAGIGMEKNTYAAYELYRASIDAFNNIIPLERNFDEAELEEAEDGVQETKHLLHLPDSPDDKHENIRFS
jgi:TPR repeat protein